MATISELMVGKAPGSVKVRREGWFDTVYFVPYFTAIDHSDWVGVDDAGRHFTAPSTTNDWLLYTEPKRKVAMYLWAVRVQYVPLFQTTNYYESEAALRADIRSCIWCQRLDHTKIEVEEDV